MTRAGQTIRVTSVILSFTDANILRSTLEHSEIVNKIKNLLKTF